MKYGEILCCPGWNYFTRKVKMYYRFRMEPVPFISRNKGSCFYNYYKKPKTTNERKQWDKVYGRRKRNPINLPTANDDFIRSDIRTRRSWKNLKVKKQWMKRKK